MRHVEPTPSGTFRVRFRLGKRQTSETFRSRKQAETFAKWLDALGPQGALDQLYAAEQQEQVPALDEIAAEHIALRPDVTDGTRLNYTRLWGRTWSPLIGHMPANRVTDDDLARAVIALGRTYSRKSLRNQQGLLSGVIGRAVRRGYLPENIARAMPLPAGTHNDRAEMRILSPDEINSIVDRTPEHYRTLIRFMFSVGCRWGEAVALQVQDVALPNIRIRRALKWSPDNNRVMGAPKTRKGNRTVAITGEMFDEMQALVTGRAGNELVFTAPRGGPVLHRTFWSRVWLPAVSHLEPRPRIHDLRHSHASWLLAHGIPIHVVQARLGHSSIQITVDTYGHLLPDAQLMAANAAALAFTQRPALPG